MNIKSIRIGANVLRSELKALQDEYGDITWAAGTVCTIAHVGSGKALENIKATLDNLGIHHETEHHED